VNKKLQQIFFIELTLKAGRDQKEKYQFRQQQDRL
jgi:hypothetical protein